MAFARLSGDVIARIISLTTPQDACTMSSVATYFRSIADSDQVWANFLPPNCENLIPQISPKKSLYRHLCDHPVPIDGRNMNFSLDKKSGKKCFMLGARDLGIIWGDDQRYWHWIAAPESRFNEVAQLRHVWWLFIIGKIEASMLSSGTNYAAYFVFQFKGHKDGFDQPVKSHVYIDGEELDEGRSVTLDPKEGEPRAICERADGWMEIKMGEFRNENGDDRMEIEMGEFRNENGDDRMEIEMGEFHNENGDDRVLVCTLREYVRHKSGLVVEGIELRPKETH